MSPLSTWTPRERPARTVIEGSLVRLEPLDAARHGDGLYAASTAPGAEERFRWLFESPPADRASFQPWLDRSSVSEDPLFFVVVDKATGRVLGRQALMRIDPAFGVIEIGNICWGPEMARRPAATEAFFLLARHVFDDLGYRRFEWKCNERNEPSKRAAERFGFSFEGVFRQHMIIKGENRDTAWFSMLNGEWPTRKAGFLRWLDEENFDAEGNQKTQLSVR